MGKWSLIGAWALVAVLATTLTWQIVSAADEQVSERPVAPLQVGAPLVSASDAPTTTAVTTTDGSAGSSVTVDQAGSTATTATTAAQPPASSAPPVSTAAAWKSETIATGGGVVVVAYRDGEVSLGSASPAAGFAVDVKKAGPSEVEVEFESESSKFEVKARWSGGELRVETDSESEED